LYVPIVKDWLRIPMVVSAFIDGLIPASPGSARPTATSRACHGCDINHSRVAQLAVGWGIRNLTWSVLK